MEEKEKFVKSLFNKNFRGSLSYSLYENLYYYVFYSDKYIGSKLQKTLNSFKRKDFYTENTQIEYLPDIIVNTLLVILLQNKYNRQYIDVKKFSQFLFNKLEIILSLNRNMKPIAFELIFISLITELQNQDIDILPQQILHKLSNEVEASFFQKYKNIYANRTTAHSILDGLSFLGNKIDWEKLYNYSEKNGSMGIYPSSTIALVKKISNEFNVKLQSQYIYTVFKKNKGLVPFYPTELFEKWWSLYYLSYSSSYKVINQHIHFYEDYSNIAVSKEFSLDDVDTSAMRIIVMMNLGQQIKTDHINEFYENNAFICYKHETRTSPSANIHALHALLHKNNKNKMKNFKDYKDVLKTLLVDIENNFPIADKWHLSSLYVISHLVFMLVEVYKNNYEKDINLKIRKLFNLIENFVITQKKEDGGFGTHDLSNFEETAYSLHIFNQIKSLNLQQNEGLELIFSSGKKYLFGSNHQKSYPLWIGKSLYTSLYIDKALKLSLL